MVNDVKPGGIARNGRLRRYCRIYRPNVRFRRRILGVLRISGEGEESYGGEDGEDRDDHDEFGERECPRSLARILRWGSHGVPLSVRFAYGTFRTLRFLPLYPCKLKHKFNYLRTDAKNSSRFLTLPDTSRTPFRIQISRTLVFSWVEMLWNLRDISERSVDAYGKSVTPRAFAAAERSSRFSRSQKSPSFAVAKSPLATLESLRSSAETGARKASPFLDRRSAIWRFAARFLSEHTKASFPSTFTT